MGQTGQPLRIRIKGHKPDIGNGSETCLDSLLSTWTLYTGVESHDSAWRQDPRWAQSNTPPAGTLALISSVMKLWLLPECKSAFKEMTFCSLTGTDVAGNYSSCEGTAVIDLTRDGCSAWGLFWLATRMASMPEVSAFHLRLCGVQTRQRFLACCSWWFVANHISFR